jgi:hypothetical protein
MSTTLCRGCGQPLEASQDVCTNCGIRSVASGNGSATAAVTGAIATAPISTGAATPDAAATSEVTTPIEPPASIPPVSPPPTQAASLDPPAAAEATTPMYPFEQTYVPPTRNTQARKIALTLALSILLGLVARAGLGALSDRGEEGDLVAQVPVTANGGKATFGDGGKIEVPKGAVTKPKTINVYRRTIDRRVSVVPPSGGTPLIFPPGTLVVYTFGPTTLVFLRPIVILLPVPAGQQGIVFLTQNGQIRFLPGAPAGGTIRVLVTSFNLNTPGAITVAQV